MILIITHKTDFTADFLINKLNQQNIKYKRFNCEDILDYNYSVSYEDDFKISLLGEVNINSIWFRRTKLPIINDLPLNEKVYILNEIDSLINNLFCIINGKWISNPFSVYKAENKLFQLKIAKEIGFKIPDTIVTSSKEDLKTFYKKHNGNIIIKPLNQTRINDKDAPSFIFTNRVKQEQIEKIENFDLTPCIYQNEIEKRYEIRVTVVGNKVFAAAVNSQMDNETLIDWRRKKLIFRKIDLPLTIRDLCIDIVRYMNLTFGAIDLIKDKNGDYIFLEINPNGQWAWIEAQTSLNISDSIIKELQSQ